MKKTILALPLAVLLAAGACSLPEAPSSETPTQSIQQKSSRDYVLESTTATPTTSATPEVDFESDEFNELVLSSVFADEGIFLPEGVALEYAQVVCGGLEDGLDLTEIVSIGSTYGPVSDLMDNAFMVGASVGTVCPEYSYILDNY